MYLFNLNYKLYNLKLSTNNYVRYNLYDYG
jgi:hypothetical protein